MAGNSSGGLPRSTWCRVTRASSLRALALLVLSFRADRMPGGAKGGEGREGQAEQEEGGCELRQEVNCSY